MQAQVKPACRGTKDNINLEVIPLPTNIFLELHFIMKFYFSEIGLSEMLTNREFLDVHCLESIFSELEFLTLFFF